jgi:hypothetical protein
MFQWTCLLENNRLNGLPQAQNEHCRLGRPINHRPLVALPKCLGRVCGDGGLGCGHGVEKCPNHPAFDGIAHVVRADSGSAFQLRIDHPDHPHPFE